MEASLVDCFDRTPSVFASQNRVAAVWCRSGRRALRDAAEIAARPRSVFGGMVSLSERSPHQLKEQSVEKRLVTRYAMRSAEEADENQRRVEGVFQELAATQPDNVSYLVLRLADDSFVHVSFHDHGEDDVNPIASTAAFAHCQDGHADRREGGVDQQTAELVGAYVTEIA